MRWLAALLLLLAGSADAQIGLPWPGPGGIAGTGAGSIALIANTTAVGANTTTTSPAISTTGASLIVVTLSQFGGAGFAAVSDSVFNSYTAGPSNTTGNICHVAMFYKYAPSTSASHTFTFTGSSVYAGIYVQVFSGTTGSTIDQQNNNVTPGPTTTTQPGSITPANNNEVVTSGVCFSDSSATYSVNSSMIRTDTNNWNGSSNEGGAAAYIVQTSAGAINPTWTAGTQSINEAAAVIASFQ